MIGVVTHQGREIERHGKAGLPLREQELVPLVRIARTPEAGELPHRPQSAAIAGGVNASRVRVETGHSQRLGARLSRVKRRVDRLDFLLRVGERDVAKLSLLVFLPPLGDFLAEQAQLGALFLDRRDQLVVGRAFGAGALEFRHLSSSPRTSSPLCRNSSSATANGGPRPSSTEGICSSSRLIVAVSFHRRTRIFCSTISITRSRNLSRLRALSFPLCSR